MKMISFTPLTLLCISMSINGNIVLGASVNFREEETPILTWHGVNNEASSCIPMIDIIRESLPHVHVLNVMIGDNLEEDSFNSILMPATDQIDEVCRQIQRDPALAGGYNGVGRSQGGLLMRGLVERCPNPPMKNLITLGAPHQGVYGFPHCVGETVPLCELLRELLSFGAYVPWVQDLITPAQYYRDPLNITAYLEGSHYLADINNHRAEKNHEYKKAIEQLENFVLVAFENETVVQPMESSHFEFYIPGNEYDVLPLKESPMYKEDWLGLRALDETGRLHLLFSEGDHMQFDHQWFTENIVIPFLVQ